MTIIITDQEVFDNRPLMDPDVKKEWLEALRSGKYNQGHLYLNNSNNFCCLGVLCELFVDNNKSFQLEKIIIEKKYTAYNRYMNSLPEDFAKMLNIPQTGKFWGFLINHCYSLSSLNDNGFSFQEISEVIEKYF